MGFLGSGAGSWWTSCQQDSRFNLSGEAAGIFGAQEAITKAILAKQKELGLTDAQLDALTIETGFVKD